MKGRGFTITVMAMVLALIVVSPDTGQAEEYEQLKEYYQNYISECIVKNQSKVDLQNSILLNMQACGIVALQKVSFLTNNQDILIDEMIKNNIGQKPYKVDYYLNKKFHETIE